MGLEGKDRGKGEGIDSPPFSLVPFIYSSFIFSFFSCPPPAANYQALCLSLEVFESPLDADNSGGNVST